MTIGRVNPDQTLEAQGISGLGQVYYNLLEPAIIEEALRRDEGELGKGGAFLCETGEFTGRSPKDKFTVKTATTADTIWWENTNEMSEAHFDVLHADMLAHMRGRDYFVQDVFCGADPSHRLDVRLCTELAWHNLFIRHMFRRPDRAELDNFVPEFTVINCPSFKADPARHGCRSETVIAMNIDKKMILIANTQYAGENKKGIFGLMNYLLPEKGVMPMHCSANHVTGNPVDSAVFFGLSGTGKTTLSADSERTLIGDDEHGWSDRGTFNFEGGCYAKVINLSAEQEPEIYATTQTFGTILENVVINDQTRELDLNDDSLTENTRGSYPIAQIPNASADGRGSHPGNIVFLTCDAFGVLPPVSKLNSAQAMYHFINGYTAKVAGTEKGVTEPTPTFSPCFGGPFLPLHPRRYAELLGEKIDQHKVNVWFINTGWSGGPYGEGARMAINHTRAIINAALDGKLNDVATETDPVFGFEVPTECPGVPTAVLDPRNTWADPSAYDTQARKLAGLFQENFTMYAEDVPETVRAAGPLAA